MTVFALGSSYFASSSCVLVRSTEASPRQLPLFIALNNVYLLCFQILLRHHCWLTKKRCDVLCSEQYYEAILKTTKHNKEVIKVKVHCQLFSAHVKIHAPARASFQPCSVRVSPSPQISHSNSPPLSLSL
eukprot:scpid108990/ scgid18758/ 